MDSPLINLMSAILSAEMGVVIACPVYQDGSVKQLTATGAFPGFEGANEIIKSLRKHTTLATWTVHNAFLLRP